MLRAAKEGLIYYFSMPGAVGLQFLDFESKHLEILLSWKVAWVILNLGSGKASTEDKRAGMLEKKKVCIGLQAPCAVDLQFRGASCDDTENLVWHAVKRSFCTAGVQRLPLHAHFHVL